MEVLLCADGCAVYCDLSTDETLFVGKGDYQFDIYRLMRQENQWVQRWVQCWVQCLYFSVMMNKTFWNGICTLSVPVMLPFASITIKLLCSRNNWEGFNPSTNVLWIHYVADKLFKCKKYDDVGSRAHNAVSRAFRTLLRTALNYDSALHLVKECPFFLAS